MDKDSQPNTLTQTILNSRQSRIETTLQNKNGGRIRSFFRKGVGKYIFKALLEAIPSPVEYGPGDLITGIGAVTGRDVISGEKLDTIDRIVYGIATAIPYVPAVYLVEPIRFLRRWVEDSVYSRNK